MPLTKRLHHHQIIGVDFDFTLYQHPNSHILWDYIANNSHKHYWIITYRNGRFLNEMWEQLADETPLISQEYFVGVKHISHKLFDAHRNYLISGDERVFDKELEYQNFKGNAAFEVGATIMIDDKRHTERNIRARGLDYLHPDDFKQ